MKGAFLFRECMKGSSLLRAVQNHDVSTFVRLHGACLDLGAKNGSSSYYEFITQADGTQLTFSDLYSTEDHILKIDLNARFPLSDSTFDNVLLFNVLEHVFDTSNVLGEIRRVLKPGGRLFGAVPFLHRYHKDPTDYWRFTHEALEILLSNAGYSNIVVRPHGLGAFTVAVHQFAAILKLRPLIFVCWRVAIGLDRIMDRVWKTNRSYYLGLYFEAGNGPETRSKSESIPHD